VKKNRIALALAGVAAGMAGVLVSLWWAAWLYRIAEAAPKGTPVELAWKVVEAAGVFLLVGVACGAAGLTLVLTVATLVEILERLEP